MTLNTDLIQARFEDIRQSLERLKQVRSLSRAQFLADQDTLDITCYRLLMAIAAALHICFHINASGFSGSPKLMQAVSSRWERPASYRQI